MNSKEGYKTKKEKKRKNSKEGQTNRKGRNKKGTLKKKQQHFTTLRGYRMLQVFRG